MSDEKVVGFGRVFLKLHFPSLRSSKSFSLRAGADLLFRKRKGVNQKQVWEVQKKNGILRSDLFRNIFDFIIVALSVVETMVDWWAQSISSSPDGSNSFRVMRALRLARTLRGVRIIRLFRYFSVARILRGGRFLHREVWEVVCGWFNVVGIFRDSFWVVVRFATSGQEV